MHRREFKNIDADCGDYLRFPCHLWYKIKLTCVRSWAACRLCSIFVSMSNNDMLCVIQQFQEKFPSTICPGIAYPGVIHLYPDFCPGATGSNLHDKRRAPVLALEASGRRVARGDDVEVVEFVRSIVSAEESPCVCYKVSLFAGKGVVEYKPRIAFSVTVGCR